MTDEAMITYSVLVCYLVVIAEHVGVPKRQLWFPFIAGAATALLLWLWPLDEAHADALWDWYFGAGSAKCGEIGNIPELAVAVGNGLPIASASPAQIHAWFARHPQYVEEIARQKAFMERTCRPD
jgi:hypothetical protein